MLDTNIKLFEFQLPSVQSKLHTAMIVGGCNAYVGNYIVSEYRGYSEWEI